MEISYWFYVGFTICVLAMLAVDLGVFHRTARVVRLKEAGAWVAVWVALAFSFATTLFFWQGADNAVLFLTGYLIEQSLSIDNIFVIAMIFSYFRIPAAQQHRVLFWGILGALLLRGMFIAVGALLIRQFSWMMYVFGAFLIVTGVKMALRQTNDVNANQNLVVRTARRFISVVSEYDGQRFFTVQEGRRQATPLFLALLMVEFTDLVFAADSIPAIFAVTTNTFLVYTSNVFAILGLRSMYFLLAGIVHQFAYLRYGLALILTFVGFKMVVSDILHVPVVVSLAVIGVTLSVCVGASLRYR